MYTCVFASARNIKAKDIFERIREPFIYMRDTEQTKLSDKRNGEDVYPANLKQDQCFQMCFNLYGASYLSTYSFNDEFV